MTCAHCIVDIVPNLQNQLGEISQPKSCKFFLGGTENDLGKNELLISKIHIFKEFAQHPKTQDGYDFAIATIEKNSYIGNKIIPKSLNSWWGCFEDLDIEVNDQICILGFPNNKDLDNIVLCGVESVIAGITNSFQQDQRKLIMFNGSIDQGMSGGPIYLIKNKRYIHMGIVLDGGKVNAQNMQYGMALTQDIIAWIEHHLNNGIVP
ncbi:UNKNOWN [Stylonychia lemnae]|uniref:Serine protease n=1 Tax=Stylonychia lemnae TaxID=5949 RepID=A0A078B6V2_STYLE|nr:UNKNOWN [Stylonychia lemnae]|eukprot:CDW89022.1 UNKNOWN [Stylonychia lemnae]